jgi:serine/threonine-protein kinase
MAEVFLARVQSCGGFEKKVVLKSVLPCHAEEESYVKMLLNEARIAASLDHPNLVQVLDLIEHEDRFFIVMEYLDGHNLRQVLRQAAKRRQRIAPGVACRIVADVLGGLAYAHARTSDDGKPLGLVHRDVSPPNVIVGRQGGVKLIDFGIAKAMESAGNDLTRAGQFKGKCAYMSPEQVRCKGVDRKSDLFSSGILLWELLTGKRLFLRDGDLQSMAAICKEPAAAPSTAAPGLAPELDAICAKALSIDPEQRYQSAGEMRQAIEALLLEKGWAASAMAVQRHLDELFERDDFDERETNSLHRKVKHAPITTTLTAVSPAAHESTPIVGVLSERDAAPGAHEATTDSSEMPDATIKTIIDLRHEATVEEPVRSPRARGAFLYAAGAAILLGALVAFVY